jgi:site-specific DNA-methyltransferase (cytosine-N4-specific)
MLTDRNDFVLDPFAGSCITGEVAERLKRNWACCDLMEDYLHGALGRFQDTDSPSPKALFARGANRSNENFYRVYHPGSLWDENTEVPLQEDGGLARPATVNTNGKRRTKAKPAKSK